MRGTCPCGSTDGVNKSNYCAACQRRRSKEWRDRNPARSKELERRSKYGIEPAEYEAMIERQGNACAICGTSEWTPCVDHDHDTNRVRGLLCKACNLALGHMKDDVANILRAADYLLGVHGEVRV